MKKILKIEWLRVAMIVAVVTTAFAGTAWAQQVSNQKSYSKECTFGTGLEVGYSCTLEVNGVTWEMSTVKSKSPEINATANGITFAGNGQKYFEKVTFTTTYFNDKKVKSVTLNVNKNGTLTAAQEEVQIGSATTTNNGPITVSANTGDGGELSIVYTPSTTPVAFTIASITVVYEYALPHFSRNSGQFHNAFDLVLSTATPGATIYYTTGDTQVLDGDNLSDDAQPYNSPIQISETTTTVNAVTFKNGERSAIVTETFTYTSTLLISYKATLYVNGVAHEYEGIEEYAAIPTPETPKYKGFEFVGWVKNQINEENAVNTAPEYWTDLTMRQELRNNEDEVVLYALYAEVTHYDDVTFTSDGTSQTITVSTFPVGKNGSDITISISEGQLEKIVVTYAADAGNNVIDHVTNGAKLHNKVGNTQTISFSTVMNEVTLYKSKGQGISASQIVVTAVKYSKFCTNFDEPKVKVYIPSSTGYAAFSSDVALDFENTAITAYTVKLTGRSLQFNTVNQVPANTGVVLESKNGGALTNGVEVSELYEAEPVTNNDLKVSATAFKPTAQYTIYCLAVIDDKVGFYPVGTSVTVPAGKPYLEVQPAASGEGNVKGFIFNFDDGATAISSPVVVEDGAIYNLAGQRLQKMQKGINIINGKKILF